MAKNLIIYYSRRGQNYVAGMVRDLAKGCGEWVVEYLQKVMDADTFQIETVKSYGVDYRGALLVAKPELDRKARPELKAYLDDISAYDKIFVVGPSWYGLYPMAMYTQLERLDFAGKTVNYVVVHEGSALGGVPESMKESCKGAVIGESLAVRGAEVEKLEAEVTEWAKKLL